MTDKKNILLVTDRGKRNTYDYGCEIYELSKAGYNVYVAGENGELPVNDGIIRLIKNKEKFDAVILNMFMAFGDLGSKESDGGWSSGEAFIKSAYENEVEVPFVIYDVLGRLSHINGYGGEGNGMTVENGDIIPMIIRGVDNQTSCKDLIDTIVSFDDDGLDLEDNSLDFN